MSAIPFYDVGQAIGAYREELREAASEVIDSGWYVLGPQVANFEAEFARYCSAGHCVGVGNGLDALALIVGAYLQLGRLKAGDRVLMPANSFIATYRAVMKHGLVPVLVDPEADTCVLGPTGLAAAEGDFAAVVVVHLYGQMADMEAVSRWCQARGALCLEDAAQAHGAERAGLRAGAAGDAAAFSFYPTKPLGALGDAGGVTTNDARLAALVRDLANYGSATKNHHPLPGDNSRLDEIQAAFLRVALRHLHEGIAERRHIAKCYQAGIHNPLIKLPVAAPDSSPVWHIYAVQCERREELAKHLAACGIGTAIHYPTPPWQQPAYLDLSRPELAVATNLHRSVLSLPIYPGLHDASVAAVIDACNSFI